MQFFVVGVCLFSTDKINCCTEGRRMLFVIELLLILNKTVGVG